MSLLPSQVPEAVPAEPASGRPALVWMLPAERIELCRRPTSAGAPWEAALAAGNRRAIDGAWERLRAAVPEIDRVVAAPWVGRPWVLDDAAALFGGADVVAVSDDVLGQQRIDPSRAYLVADQEVGRVPVPLEDLEFGVVRPSVVDVTRLLRSGGGLLVTGIEEHSAALNRAIEDLDRVQGLSCRVDLEVVGPDGFIVEADGFGRVVVAVEGEALVEVREPQVPEGMAPPLPASFPVAEGRGVVVPPGWGHRALPAGDGAVLAAVVIPFFSVKALALELEEELPFWPLLRSDLPLDRRAPHASYDGSVYETGLAAAVAAAMPPDAVDRVLARGLMRVGARWAAPLSASIAALDRPQPSTRFRVPLPGGIQVAMAAGEDPVVLFANRRQIATSPEVAGAIGAVADGAEHTIDDLAALAPRGAAMTWGADLFQDLIRVGIAEVVAP